MGDMTVWHLYRDRNGQRCVLAPSLSLELTALGGSKGYSEGEGDTGFLTYAQCWLVDEGPVRLYAVTPAEGTGQKAAALLGLASAPRFPVAGFQDAAGVSLISTGEM